MFDEIAQNEEDAEDYDMEALERRTAAMQHDDDDAATLVDGQDGSDDEDPTSAKKRRGPAQHEGEEHEREGLMTDR
ncbi:hypothetical protein K474DRAFT_1767895 [Panus rudis PR-1116 ss-1]|nr:hypothetical protein K474DRAFT_1767895 [Panus rudis PR-1116 ss-1]